MPKPPEEFTPTTHDGEEGWLWEGPAETLIRKGDQNISETDLRIAWVWLQTSGQMVNLRTDQSGRPSRNPSDYDRKQAQAAGSWFIRRDFHHHGTVATVDGEWLILAEQCDGRQRTKSYPPRSAGGPVPADEDLAAENERLRAENSRLNDGLRQIARLVEELRGELPR